MNGCIAPRRVSLLLPEEMGATGFTTTILQAAWPSSPSNPDGSRKTCFQHPRDPCKPLLPQLSKGLGQDTVLFVRVASGQE